MQMAKYVCTLVLSALLLLVLGFHCGHAQEHDMGVTVELSMSKARYKAADTQTLIFTLRNKTGADITVLKWFTPLEGMNSNIFRVELEGRSITYLGRTVKRGAFSAEDSITLKPGESKQVNVDISKNYDIREVGSYSVSFKGALVSGRNVTEMLARKAEESVTPLVSNVATFELLEPKEGVLKPKSMKDAAESVNETADKAAAKRLLRFHSCSSQQQRQLIAAKMRAEEIAANAKMALAGTPEGQRAGARRYSEWFGDYNQNRYTVVTQNFKKILEALSTKPIEFDCSCTENYYAYVYPSKPYKIYLCNAFWTASILGTDSQAGTLIHEISHFNAVTGTDDHTYGQSNCRNLANNDPAKAIQNADSHEYFAENTPSLTMGTSATMAASLAASNSDYLVAEGGGGGAVNANRRQARTWETLTLVDVNGGTLESGDAINIGTYDAKHFLVAESGGGREVKANRPWARSWETFVLRKVNGSGRIRFGDSVSLQAHNGQYVVAEGGGGGVVNANRNWVRSWETFRLYAPASSNTLLVNLQANNGKYMVAEGGGGGAVNANRTEARHWETFTVIDVNGGNLRSGDSVILRSFDQIHYLVAEGGGGREVKANRPWARSWETFTIGKVNGSGQIASGDTVSLKASNGQYVVAEGGGGGVVNANRNAVGSWEKFKIHFIPR